MFDRISDGIYWDRLLRLVDGCTPCSPGCEHCWSARYCHRFPRYSGLTHALIEKPSHREISFNGKIRLNHYNLDLPLRTKKPQAWLILNDLFHKDVHRDFILKSFIIMRTAKQHIFLVLTKRIDRAEKWINEWRPAAEALADMSFKINRFPNNIWLGVTVCGPDELWKIEYLLQIPAAVKWVSIEPMLGEIDLSRWFPIAARGKNWERVKCEAAYGECKPRISWTVLGGETGPGARPMNPDWVRSVRDQCQTAAVPFFFKNWGSGSFEMCHDYHKGRNWPDYKSTLRGRLLDGREWNELPEVKG